jgi:hypothetical protein
MSSGVASIYRCLIRARLRERTCEACGRSLESATVVSSAEGTTLEEYGLSETSSLQLLVATELLSVQCEHCSVTCSVGTPLAHLAEARTLTDQDLAEWSPGAVSAYRSVIHSRLEDRTCGGCGSPLQATAIEQATGGSMLPGWDLSDESSAALIAWTQSLTVRCPQCQALTKA